jgi:hypothetical protein
VAAVLLATAIGLVAQGAVSAQRMALDMRHYQLAVDELSGQLASLVEMGDSDRELALTSLQLSAHVASRLPAANLDYEIEDDEHGRRLVLSLQWKRIGDPPPLILVAWLDSLPSPRASRGGSEP